MQRHVIDPDFESNINVSLLMEQLLKVVPRIGSTDAQLVMMEQYETLFRIYDHRRKDVDRPFASLELHPAEDTLTTSLLYERIEQFAFHDVKDAFGLSLLEFLELPSYMASEVMRLAAIRHEKEARQQGSTAAAIKALGDGLK